MARADSVAASVPPDTVAAAPAAVARPDTAAARPGAAASASPRDTAESRRVVREFPAIEVRALLHDLRSSETVHEIPAAALRSYPADGLAQLVALQAGV